jgi:hypothetical protein
VRAALLYRASYTISRDTTAANSFQASLPVAIVAGQAIRCKRFRLRSALIEQVNHCSASYLTPLKEAGRPADFARLNAVSRLA